MEKNKVLILIGTNSENIFTDSWLGNGYKTSDIFKNVSKPLRALRRIWLKNNYAKSYIWFGNWFNKLDEYDSVIIHMSRLTRYIPKLIVDKYPHIKVIGWYWNTVDDDTRPIYFDNKNIEYWSFDENDCKKYGFKQNIQYYCVPKNIDSKKEYDIYFVGRDKGRKEEIDKINELATNQALKCLFRVIKEDKDIITYNEVKKELAKSKAVLEINKENQVGFTLRVLESLFFGIKLITNNNLIKESPIYNKNNVFIIGEDDEKHLKDFINSKYDHSVDIYKKEYDLDKWFNNFYE